MALLPLAARSCVAPKADAASLLASKVRANCQRAIEAVRKVVNQTTLTATFPAAELKERSIPRRLPGEGSKIPAITYSRVLHTTIGPGRLTAVFGMGTGVTIQVCSPETTCDMGMVQKGVRHLLPERPEGCFAQKVPDPFLNHTHVMV
jgi:hypothetical protein